MSLINGDIIVVDKEIGQGGTATIYSVINYNKQCVQCAKHLYGKYSADPYKYYKKYKVLSQMKSPHPAFVWGWPDGVTKFEKNTRSFLFVMEMLDDSYKKILTIMRNPERLSLRDRIEICLVLADAAKAADDVGLVYGDWSGNNVMWKLNPDKSVSVRIIDCDGMSLPGAPLGLGGTGKYRSPEVMAGAEQTAQSDIHSLAVVTFRLFCGNHPLDGKLTRSEPETEESITKYYCQEPIFIFDGTDNEPEPIVKKRFDSLPDVLQQYYNKIFSNSCLHGREARPDASCLKEALTKAMKEIA